MPKVTIDYGKCQFCKTCVSVCPMGVYVAKADKVVPENQDSCIACRACESACPVGAITVQE